MTEEKGILFNGKPISLDEINAKMKELTELTKLKKAAKEAGVFAPTKATVEKPAEFNLVKLVFEPVVVANADIIAKLFEVLAGQDSVSIPVTKKYSIIIRDMDITKDKIAKRKESAALAAKELAEANAEMEAMAKEQ